MSKLAHSNQETMDRIETAALAREGIYKCLRCDGTGVIDVYFRRGSDRKCPECDGEGLQCHD